MKREKKQVTKKKTIRQKKKENKKNRSTKKPTIKTNSDKVNSNLINLTHLLIGSNQRKKKIMKEKKNKNKFTLTNDQLAQLESNHSFYENKTVEQLKAILKKNNQVSSGSKSDLVERCSQGKLLGALPNCPECFGGKLRFNIKTGEYKCPGFMDDTDFRSCSYKTFTGIQRNKWED